MSFQMRRLALVRSWILLYLPALPRKEKVLFLYFLRGVVLS
jgi:hypothetical protein